MSKYDITVIGSGVGGLVAASLLTKAGKKVLVLEKHHTPGGCAQAFTRKGILFDSSVHVIGGCGESGDVYSGLIYWILKTIGHNASTLFKKIDPAFTVYFDSKKIIVPSGFESLIEFMTNQFPESKKELIEFFKRVERISLEARMFPVKLTLEECLLIPFKYHHCGRFGHKTLHEVLDYYKFNDEIRAILLAINLFLGTDPDKISFLQWSVMWMSYISEGTYYCKNSYQAFVNVLCNYISSNGGAVTCKSEVGEIVVNNKKVCGVKLANGDFIESPIVISNTEPVITFEKLVKNTVVPKKIIENLKKYHYSRSPFSMYFLIERTFIEKYNLTHQSFFLPDINVQKCFDMSSNGEIGEIYLTIPSITTNNPDELEQRKAIITILTWNKPESFWKEHKTEFVNFLCEAVEKFLPGFTKAVTILDSATPQTVKRYTGAPDGSMIGYDYRVNQIGFSRPGPKTPLNGLYLTGQWSKPGGGVYGVCISGCNTAQLVLKRKNLAELFKKL